MAVLPLLLVGGFVYCFVDHVSRLTCWVDGTRPDVNGRHGPAEGAGGGGDERCPGLGSRRENIFTAVDASDARAALN